MQKVYLEIDAKTGALKAKLNTSSGDVKTWAIQAEKSGKQAAKGFDETTKAADRLGGSLTGVKRILATAFTAAGVIAAGKAIFRTADEVANLEARLKIATSTTAEYNAAQIETVNIANRSAATISDTVNLYARLSVALRETGVAQRDVFQLTETINKAFVVSGATAIEASNAIRQLAQGMASGVLRGEEYNAISEQGDRVIQALADSLKKTRGELRAMANDGKLTTEIVTNALLSQANVIENQYSEFPVTVARSITLMGNAWTGYISEAETAREISQTVADSIIFLSENLETVIDGVLTLTQVVVALAGARGLRALAASFALSSAASKKAATGAYSYATSMGAARVSVGAFGATVKRVSTFLKTNILGIAIFGGIELLSFIGDLVGEIETIPTAVDRVNGVFDNGFSLEGLRAAGAEVANLKVELLGLETQLTNVTGLQKRAGESSTDYAIRMSAAGNAQAALTSEIEKTGFALTKANFFENVATAVTVATIGIDSLKESYSILTTEVDENNKALDKWLETQEKQIQKMVNANTTFGKGKVALLLLEAAQLKATTTNKKYHKEIDRVTAAKIKEIESTKELTDDAKLLNDATKVAIELAAEYLAATDPIASAEAERAIKLNQIALALKNKTISEKQAAAATKGAALIVADAEQGLNKYSESIRTADDILEDLGLTTNRVDADLALLASAFYAATAAMDLAKAAQYAEAMTEIARQASAAAGAVNQINGINPNTGGLNNDATFEGLVEQGLTLKDIFASMANSMDQGAAGIANAINVGIQGAQFISDIWASTQGQDGPGRILDSISQVAESGLLGPVAQAIAQVARSINALTGGKLFGTSYETVGASSTINIGSGGATGVNQTFRERERSLFRGTQRQTIVDNFTGEALEAINALFEGIETGVSSLASALGGEIPTLITGAFFSEFDKDGNLIKEQSTILGRTYSEDFAAFSARLLAENLIAVLDSVLPQVEVEVQNAIDQFGLDFEGIGTLFDNEGISRSTRLMGEASALAETYRAQGAEALLDFAKFATLAVADLQDSNAILGSLTSITAITEQLANAGESLSETYIRLRGSVLITDDALALLGVTMDLSAEAYIAFAAGITDAAGGLPQASALWRDFFEGFYSPAELSTAQLGQSATGASALLEPLGFDLTTSLAGFREAFESVFNTLSPEDVVIWLQAGGALSEYNTLLLANTELLGAQVTAQIEANDALRDAVRGVNDDILGLLRSDFQNTLAEINAQERQTIATLNELAIAAGRAGASEEQLGRVHLRTSLQTTQAIAQLRSAAEGLINQLYGDQLDQRISELEAIQTNGVTNVGNAAENTYERQLALIRRIRDVIDSTLIDERLSPLSRTDQLNEGVSQFQALIDLANTGDLDAQAQLPALYQELLGIGRDVFASGQGYTDLFAQLTGLLNTVEATGSASTGPQTVIMLPSPELVALYAERDARLAQQTAAERLEMATQLASHLVDLSAALNTPLIQIAEELGVTMGALVNDLGVNLDTITVETVNQLANVANTLGISLNTLTTELGENVGAELGHLAQAQSLLNDALETRIDALPEGFRDSLAASLRAVENAAEGTERDAALAALEALTSRLPIEQRNQLAPFFDNINVVSEVQEQVLIANRMEVGAELRRLLLVNQLNALQDINANLQAQNTNAGIPSFAVGSTGILKDTLANVHKGEIIMTAQESAIMKKYFGGGGNAGGNSATMDTGLMRELIRAVKSGNERTNNALESISDSTGSISSLKADRLVLPRIKGRPSESKFSKAVGGLTQ